MDYGQEAITSLIWILQTLAITSVVFSFGIFLLVRFTQWGKQPDCLARLRALGLSAITRIAEETPHQSQQSRI